MRYFWTFVWALLISSTISYVLSSMAGDTLQIAPVIFIAAVFTFVIILLGDGILKQEE
ncbi:DUF2929 family protein [Radiobacillus sp. PE A8.2]|uniref:DUF2929 family protein n=1 Tax=Radiobacillus sp. PE A8.2 TaxID=3380349 RepID=UPI00388E1D42